MISERAQRILLWWGLAFTVIYGLAWWRLFHMMPPPSAKLQPGQIADFYREHSTEIKVGAVLASWTSGFMVPIAVVVGVQISRHEKGRPVWSTLAIAGGTLMSVVLVLPPIFWGVAAFTPNRSPDITAIMHELAMLTFVTTDQYYIFMWVAIAAACLIPNKVLYTPFPRWFGYYTAWTALMFEPGALAFLFRSGPFSWTGILAFWSPVVTFFAWIVVMATLLFKAIGQQEQHDLDTEGALLPP
ncbi:hypothetical protein [Mycobacterium sp.]|uniref:hypothetical protein n=1 Tax=Mycobacterium sp. TaxID=1785 RepID=UPI0011F643EB|nr:hypothetical protein [Mycobacterium sp.]TAM65863.1 MAG: hypothetical protein EPN51_17575 [Mycobacterium sp.]